MSERDVEFIVRGSQIAKTVHGALLKTIANQDIVNIIHRKIMSDMLTVLEDDCEELTVYLEDLPSAQAGWTGVEDDYPVSVKAVLNITAETGALETQRRVRELPSMQVPSYVAEIEEEYKKAVSQLWIHKPLAKALYEVWKKHDREDVSRHETD